MKNFFIKLVKKDYQFHICSYPVGTVVKCYVVYLLELKTTRAYNSRRRDLEGSALRTSNAPLEQQPGCGEGGGAKQNHD